MIKNWQDPYVLLMSARAFILVVHTIFGIYLWEFLQSLNFDWQFITRRRPLKAASVIYLLARYTMLVALIRWNYVLHGCAYTCVAFTSLLLYIRVVALSARNRFVVVGLGLFYATYWAFVVYGVYHVREAFSAFETLAEKRPVLPSLPVLDISHSEAEYVPELFLCAAVKLTAHRLNTIVQFSFDFTCLCVMTYFLLRGHRGGSLWKFLVQQDIVYFLCITSAYLFASVFLIINLNDAVSQAPNVFALLITSVCATRMQRGLAEFYEPSRPRTYVTTSTALPHSPHSPVAAAPFARHPLDTSGINVTVDIEEKGDAYAMSKIEAETARDFEDGKDELSSTGRDLGQV
ncbi:hypothetical protein AURDEDRAFT_165869 [Auricularia subglabra TFB-10046 SS5]|nr:hypothetical protein AURDEDRAFT_165869 [Auricularia subglabra TFB-10046 SS5]